MQNVAFTIVEADSTNPLSNVISDYVAGEQFQNDKWSTTVRLAADCNTSEEWKESYELAENDQAQRREWAGELIKRTKAGKVVASKAFPKTWNTDKVIIGKAMDNEVDLLDDEGNPKPKTALQQEYKDKVEEGKEDKTAFEKIMTTINTYGALYAQLDADEQETVKVFIGAIHTS